MTKAARPTLLVTVGALAACSALTSLDELSGGGSPAESGADVAIDAEGGGPGPVQLLTARVRGIRLDDTNIYFTEPYDQRVGVIPKSGGTPSYLADGTGGFAPFDLQLDSTTLYWSGDIDTIYSCVKAGCAGQPTLLYDATKDDATTAHDAAVAGVDDQWLYFRECDTVNTTAPCALRKIPKGGGAPADVAPDMCNSPVEGTELVGTKMYYACDDGTVGRVDVGTGVVDILTGVSPPTFPLPITVQGAALFYGLVYHPGSIYELNTGMTGGSPTPVALDQPFVLGIESEPTTLYWTSAGTDINVAGGSVSQCTIGNCSNSIKVLANNLAVPAEVRTDATTVYFSVAGNGTDPTIGIWKVPKPAP